MRMIDWAARMEALKTLSSQNSHLVWERAKTIKSGCSHDSRSSHTQTVKAVGLLNDENLKEAFEERAAIMEYEGGLPREEAERLAYEIVYGKRKRA